MRKSGMVYTPNLIEKKWQNNWEQANIFRAKNDSTLPKYYVLDMFPYPSSSGLHVGHPEGYTATDILARYKRACGYNVLHPMGWDAFGLPAEQYALQTGVHPAITTQNAIDNFRRQLKMIGFSYDWSREVSTCDPKYYKWTQYLFTKLFERGLAYQKEVPVNWCPNLKTVLANEEVVDGKSERGGHPVVRLPMKQWMLKITDYAERLLTDLEDLDWPEGTKELQRNWIGKSFGLQLSFEVSSKNQGALNTSSKLEVFTTRPDTLFGATFLVLAPEHPEVDALTTSEFRDQVKAYQKLTAQKTDVARQEVLREKTGCFIGTYAINPATEMPIPIWVADYVMINYGTGAIMAVPAHDERDFTFAKKFNLPIKWVVSSSSIPEQSCQHINTQVPDACFEGEGISIESGFINGLKTSDAKTALMDWAEKKEIGKRMVRYKLRDWLFSRQRYWGEPFPIVYSLNPGQLQKPIALEINELPVVLPEVKSYEPTGTGESPLAGISSWVEMKRSPTEVKFRRETDTMPGSAGSSWYFLRFCDPHNDTQAFSSQAVKYWMPVDLYLGGSEHAVGHLLYARFWTKVLFDAGLVDFWEPFKKLIHQGMILGEDGEKMSKSRGNVINPDDVITKYGADTLRMYEMFMAPLERDKPWSTQAIEGISRFLHRTWRLYCDESKSSEGSSNDLLQVSDVLADPESLKITHQTIKKVTHDIEGLRFNTAISQMMIFVNHFTKSSHRPRSCLKPFVQILQPFAPHIAEELWEKLGEKSTLSYEPWPNYDKDLAAEETVTIAVQVMGKTRATITIAMGSEQDQVEALVSKVQSVQGHLQGKMIKKIIFIKDRIINYVVH